MSPRVINLLLQYVTQALAYSHTWKALKPHIEQILLRWVMTVLMLLVPGWLGGLGGSFFWLAWVGSGMPA